MFGWLRDMASMGHRRYSDYWSSSRPHYDSTPLSARNHARNSPYQSFHGLRDSESIEPTSDRTIERRAAESTRLSNLPFSRGEMLRGLLARPILEPSAVERAAPTMQPCQPLSLSAHLQTYVPLSPFFNQRHIWRKLPKRFTRNSSHLTPFASAER